MGTAHTPIPNHFTTEPKAEIVATLDDGRKIYRLLTASEFRDWQESGGDLEDLIEDDDA